MLSFETVTLFIAVCSALALAPGPDNIFVLTQSALHGPKAGIFITLGLCTGLVVHTAAVALGVAAIFQTSTVAFNSLKIVGALYLLYLTFQAFKASAASLEETKQLRLTWQKLYSRGIIMNVTNPKVAIFFLAFLPQFVDPARGSVTLQLFLFGGLAMAVTLIIFSAVAGFSGVIGDWLKSSVKAQLILNRIAGTIFLGLALKLAFSEA